MRSLIEKLGRLESRCISVLIGIRDYIVVFSGGEAFHEKIYLRAYYHWKLIKDVFSKSRNKVGSIHLPYATSHLWIGNGYCKHNAISRSLRCAVKPSGSCRGCGDFELVEDKAKRAFVLQSRLNL